MAAPAAIVLLVWLGLQFAAGPDKIAAADAHGIKADKIQVGHSLAASFDAVAQSPGGEPVLFRCRAWQDDLMVRDNANGVWVRQSTPRIEVVPVRFETY
jgi:hypothetical protein